MERGHVDVSSLPGGFDLQSTVESGQSYLWDRADGRMYDGSGAHGGAAWYWTTVRVDGAPEFVRARQRDGILEWSRPSTGTRTSAGCSGSTTIWTRSGPLRRTTTSSRTHTTPTGDCDSSATRPLAA